jgi:uncharacterized protein (DUF2132 family)
MPPYRRPESTAMKEHSNKNPKDPLEGKTLKAILTELYEHFGWEGLSRQLSINCFEDNPSINSSLKFLRKTPWARTRLEKIYLSFLQGKLAQRGATALSDSESAEKDR